MAPRLAAFEILSRVNAGEFFDAARDIALTGLSPADRALAHQLAAGVLRNRTLLDRSLSPLVSREWANVQPELKDVLRIGAYQILCLDRVPTYAAVDASVEVAKTRIGRKPAGLVNAVLRKVRPGQRESTRPATAAELAREYSHPEWLVERWVKRFGFENAKALVARNNSVPSLTLKPVGVSLDELRSSFEAVGISCRDSALGAGLAIAHARVADLPGYRDGAFIVQDPAQTKMLDFAALPPGGIVWDACAAPGGKSVGIANTHRCLIASDNSSTRVQTLRGTVRRARLPRTGLVVADATTPPFAADTFDAVVIDAPCSATGTMRKHPDARWRITMQTISAAAETQRRILDSAAEMTRPGGLFVYLTCSLESLENEGQIELFLKKHPEFERTCPDLSIFPSDHGTDGAYGARLTKKR